MEIRYTRWTPFSHRLTEHGEEGALVDCHLEELYCFTGEEGE